VPQWLRLRRRPAQVPLMAGGADGEPTAVLD